MKFSFRAFVLLLVLCRVVNDFKQVLGAAK
jgi:hypothetical protein